jgi:hypothetical protein
VQEEKDDTNKNNEKAKKDVLSSIAVVFMI